MLSLWVCFLPSWHLLRILVRTLLDVRELWLVSLVSWVVWSNFGEYKFYEMQPTPNPTHSSEFFLPNIGHVMDSWAIHRLFTVARVMHIELDLLQRKQIDSAWNIWLFNSRVWNFCSTNLKSVHYTHSVENWEIRLNVLCAWSRYVRCAFVAREKENYQTFDFIVATNQQLCSHRCWMCLELPCPVSTHDSTQLYSPFSRTRQSHLLRMRLKVCKQLPHTSEICKRFVSPISMPHQMLQINYVRVQHSVELIFFFSFGFTINLLRNRH